VHYGLWFLSVHYPTEFTNSPIGYTMVFFLNLDAEWSYWFYNDMSNYLCLLSTFGAVKIIYILLYFNAQSKYL